MYVCHMFILYFQDGVHVSVMLAGVGNTYRHDLSLGEGEDSNANTGDLKDESSTYPYSVSYRTSDVNSRQLGRNTFAIRPSKSAHRSHRPKQVGLCKCCEFLVRLFYFSST